MIDFSVYVYKPVIWLWSEETICYYCRYTRMYNGYIERGGEVKNDGSRILCTIFQTERLRYI